MSQDEIIKYLESVYPEWKTAREIKTNCKVPLNNSSRIDRSLKQFRKYGDVNFRNKGHFGNTGTSFQYQSINGGKNKKYE